MNSFTISYENTLLQPLTLLGSTAHTDYSQIISNAE